MNWIKLLTLISFIFTTHSFSSELIFKDKGWELCSKNDGISLYTKKMSKTNIVPWKGKMVVDASLE